MLCRIAIAFVTALALALSPASASAQQSGTLNIVSAEIFFDIQGFQELNVTGTGKCATTGFLDILVTVSDPETGGVASGSTFTSCQFPGEPIRWLVTAPGFFNRGGDRVHIQAGAFGAITDGDEKDTVLHWQT